MVPEEDFKPFLHIVHVSDMHLRSVMTPPDTRMETRIQRLASRLRRYLSSEAAEFVETYWAEGTAGHDRSAHRRCFEFLSEFAADRNYQGIETWLVDTGDLSSMGDAASIAKARQWLEQYAKVLKATKTLCLYGNHDAWPGKFPFRNSKREMHEHREDLRSRIFPARWPLPPLEIAIPGADAKLQLFSLNSVIHDQFLNLRAHGRVGHELTWEAEEERVDQLSALVHLAKKDASANFRILAIHHPIHYPGRPQYVMSLINDVHVAGELMAFAQEERGYLPHLVLSGHTHFEFPKLGTLGVSTNPPHSPQKPLTFGQLQMIIGSLSQAVSEAERAKVPAARFFPHQFQILTFWASHEQPDLLRIQRRLVGRRGGTGSFGYMFPDESAPSPVEEVLLQYRD